MNPRERKTFTSDKSVYSTNKNKPKEKEQEPTCLIQERTVRGRLSQPLKGTQEK